MRHHALASLSIFLVAVSATAATTTIDQRAQTFSEKALSMTVGDSLIFANHDDVTHNIGIIDEDDDATDLGLQKPGQSLSYKFSKAGKFKVRCSIHPSMKMTVRVQ